MMYNIEFVVLTVAIFLWYTWHFIQQLHKKKEIISI